MHGRNWAAAAGSRAGAGGGTRGGREPTGTSAAMATATMVRTAAVLSIISENE